jgi:hypothetical protein
LATAARAFYDLEVEADAVVRLVKARGLRRYHLFGFSAAATVALGSRALVGRGSRCKHRGVRAGDDR